MKNNRKRKGFTLIELIVAIAIIALVLPAVSSAYINAANNTRAENSKLDTMTNAQSIIQLLKSQKGYGALTIYKALGNTINIKFDTIDQVVGDSGILNLPEPTDRESIKPVGDLTSTNALGSHYEAIITIENEKYYEDTATEAFTYDPMLWVSVRVIDSNNSSINSEANAFIGG